MKNENGEIDRLSLSVESRFLMISSTILLLLIITFLPAKAQNPAFSNCNPIASFSTSTSTTALCAPTPIEFQIGNWFSNSSDTKYVVDFGDGSPAVTLSHPLNPTNSNYLLTHIYTKSSCPNSDFTPSLKVTNECYTTTYKLDKIIIRQKPVADFGFPASCISNPVCIINRTQNNYLDNSCTIAGNYTWDFGDGNTSNAANPPCHTYAATGVYTIALTVSNACGNDAKTKTITVTQASPLPVATTSVVYCQGQQATPLTATGTNLLWHTSPTGGIGAAKAPIPVTTIAGNRTYYVSQTLPGICESPRVAVTVMVNPLPETPAATSPVTYCQNQSAASLRATGTGLLWYTSAIGGTGSSIAPIPSTAMPGSTIYYVSQTTPCGESPKTEILVFVRTAPSKPMIEARTPLCVGDDLVLEAYNPVAGNAVLDYVWQGPGIDFPANAPNVGVANVKMKDAGIYTVTARSQQTGCSITADTFIQIGDYPVVKFAQDTVMVATGYRLNLVPVITNADDPGILPVQRYTWTPSQDLTYNDAIRSSATVTVTNNACYTVTATNIYGCRGSGDICVKTLCRNSHVFVPNAFTPNGDIPENRKLMIRAAGINTVRSFKIFNRWGKIVFEKNNFPPDSPDFGWDGMVNGRLADAGVYIYTADVICENGAPYSFKGNITLL